MFFSRGSRNDSISEEETGALHTLMSKARMLHCQISKACGIAYHAFLIRVTFVTVKES